MLCACIVYLLFDSTSCSVNTNSNAYFTLFYLSATYHGQRREPTAQSHTFLQQILNTQICHRITGVVQTPKRHPRGLARCWRNIQPAGTRSLPNFTRVSQACRNGHSRLYLLSGFTFTKPPCYALISFSPPHLTTEAPVPTKTNGRKTHTLLALSVPVSGLRAKHRCSLLTPKSPDNRSDRNR